MPLLPTDDTRLCPYNKAHEILVTRWDNHLIKCRKQHPNSGIVICKYVWSHHIPREEIECHEKECAKSEINVGNAATAEPTFEIPDPLRAHRPGDVVIDPEWEEEVPTYDPTAAAMSKPVVRLMQNMTKRERQAYLRRTSGPFFGLHWFKQKCFNEFLMKLVLIQVNLCQKLMGRTFCV